MAVSSPSKSTGNVASNGNTNYTPALVVLTSLFFMWGFITSLNDILIPHLKAIFDLNYTQAMLVQFTFFTAYAIVSLPSGILVEKIGYKTGIIIGLLTAAIGTILFYPAAGSRSYELFLFAFFILASGITLLQVAANPYVAILGKPETASSRLNLSQAFNSLGTTIAPIFGSILILAVAAKGADEIAKLSMTEQEAYKLMEAGSVQTPYIILTGMLVLIAVIIAMFKLPKIEAASQSSSDGEGASFDHHHKSAWGYRHLVLGAIAIFVYVGGEVAIGSFLVNYFKELLGMQEADAGTYVALYWGGAMIGRFFGSITLSEMTDTKKKNIYAGLVFVLALVLAMYVTKEYQNFANFSLAGFSKTLTFLVLVAVNFVAFNVGKQKPGRTLAILAVVAAVLVIISMLTFGQVAMWSILAVGLFNSIMFPTIFTLAIDGLGKHTGQGSGILCTAIVGGALIPLAQGFLADTIGIHHAFILPVLCYAYIAYYGVKGHIPTFKTAEA
ncbi:MAG: sugar MFS transporter [Ignavibacteriales bacterium]|nr:sugar MFS transporter [Ignavibacteriales bacterium]